jgi:hypothetical protein
MRSTKKDGAMRGIWAVCALAASAAFAQQPEKREVRTLILPGNSGYIRYEVLPGDDDLPPGELNVVHEDPPPAPPPDTQAQTQTRTRTQTEPYAPDDSRRRRVADRQRRQARCAPIRGKLAARLLQLRGLDVDPDFAEWLTHNVTIGSVEGVPQLHLVGPDPLLFAAVRNDLIARSLAQELAQCQATAR